MTLNRKNNHSNEISVGLFKLVRNEVLGLFFQKLKIDPKMTLNSKNNRCNEFTILKLVKMRYYMRL